MNPVLIYIRPLNTVRNARVDVRVADAPNANDYGTGGTPWDPAITVRPKLSIELMSPDMDGRTQAGTATFEIGLAELSMDWTPLYWGGAAVVIHCTGALEGPSAVPDFWGYITSATVDYDTRRLSVTATVSTALIDQPMLTKTFGGGGGIDGEAPYRGVLMPAGHGPVKNLPPVWFDSTRNIGMIDGYSNTVSVDWLGEGLNSLGAAFAEYASYAALAAAIDAKTLPPGRWGYVRTGQFGLVGLGAPATGIITVHATFGTSRIGALMKRLALTFAAVPAARVDSAGFDALDAAVPKDIRHWTSEQVNVKDLLEQLAQSCNATPLVTFQNQVTVTRAVVGTPVATLDRSGSVDPRVLDWQFADTTPPYYQLKGRAARPATVLSTDQVNYVDNIIDRGLFSLATTYRAGNLVWLADKSSWLYTNAVASSGHGIPSPATSDAYWTRQQPPSTASDFKYSDGTPIEALKPSQVGADQTSGHVASGIAGQGPGATAGASDVLNGYTSLAGPNRVRFSQWEAGPGVGWQGIAQTGITLSSYRRDSYLGKVYLGVLATAAAANQTAGLGTTIPWPVTPGEMISFACGLQTQGGKVGQSFTQCAFLASDGSTISVVQSATRSGNFGYDSRIEIRTPVPPGAVRAQVAMYAVSNAAGLMDLAVTDPMFASVSPLQALPPPFVPGLNGYDAADVTALSQNFLIPSTSSLNFAADYMGNVDAGQLAQTVSFKRLLGTTDVSATGTTWSVAPTNGITCTISASGVVSFTAVASGKIAVTGVYNSISLTESVAITKTNAAAPSGGGTGGGGGGSSGGASASTTQISSTASTTYGSPGSNIISIAAGASAQIDLVADLTFTTVTAGSHGCYGKWQWRPAGGTFADVAAEVMSTYSAYAPPVNSNAEAETGYINCSASKSGLTSGTTYEFQWLWRASNVGRLYANGTCTAVQH